MQSKKSTKDLVLKVLAQEWPLSTKEIFMRLEREHSAGVSYQAVHKTISQMLADKVLEKEGAKFKLSKKWISDTKGEMEGLEQKYKEELYSRERPIFVKLGSFIEAGRYVIHEFMNYPNPENKPSLCLTVHTWSAIGMTEEDYNALVSHMEGTKHLQLVKGDFPLDKWFSGFYEKIGFQIKTGQDYPGDDDIIVHGDYVMYIFLPAELKEAYHKLFAETKEAEKVDLELLFKDLMVRKVEIPCLIVKNGELADYYRADALGKVGG